MGDITYLETPSRRLYLSVIIDLFSRKVVGWALDEHMRDELALEALRTAVRRRRPQSGMIHHSERDCQYTGIEYVDELASNGLSRV